MKLNLNEKGKALWKRSFEEIFGEMALLTGQTRTVDIFTTEVTRLAVLNRNDFEGLCREFPELGKILSELLIQRLSQSLDRVLEQTIGS